MPKTQKKVETKTKRKTQPALPTMTGSNRNTTFNAQLSSLTKSARDLMHKDAGLNGDLDRLPQVSWILFLKCFDLVTILKRLFGYLLLEGHLETDPSARLPVPKVGRRLPKALTIEETQALLSATNRDSKLGQRD